MGDGLDYRLDGIFSVPFPAPEGGNIPWGFRLSPGLQLNIGGFFTEFRLEGGAAEARQTAIGANYFDTAPAQVMSDRVPVSAWVYQPRDDEDLFRANFGIRSFNVGYRFTPDFQIRFGRHRYDITESQRLLMANAYSGHAKFADVNAPLHWLGGELRYERRRNDETARNVLFSGGVMMGADNTILGMVQGLGAFALSAEPRPPLLTFTAFVSLRSNPQPLEGAPLSVPGVTHGEGFAMQFDYGIFTGITGYNHRSGHSWDDLGRESVDERDIFNLVLDVHPGDFRIRGALAYLNRQKGPDIGLTPPVGMNEWDTEASVGYEFVDGIMVNAGYRGAYGMERSDHMAFIGLLSTFRGNVPF